VFDVTTHSSPVDEHQKHFHHSSSVDTVDGIEQRKRKKIVQGEKVVS